MSWRVLILFLVLAGAASWQGGLQLGEWLVARAPETVTSVAQKDYKALTLDANGRPITPQPPQPRIDGTLGVPRELPTIDWAIEALIASNFDTDPHAMKVGDEEDDAEQTEGSETADARRLLGGTKLPAGPSDVGMIDVSMPAQKAQQPASPTPPVVPPGITITVTSWQQSFKQELAQCANVGYFQRPTCLQNARNKYCGPNDAWGKTADCPPRPFDQHVGG